MRRTPDAGGSSRVRASLGSAGHAVVVGAGMAGLLAARVLANHVGQVTLVERDALTDSAQVRKGVPQGRMLHTLFPRGLEIVERLFPGYGHELKTAGAVSVRVPTEALILTPAGWLDRRATGWPLLSASRPLFEWAVRRRLRELPGVTILDRHEVTSLLIARDGRRVTGVTLRSLDGPDEDFEGPDEDLAGGHQQLDADLVVDASGRGSVPRPGCQLAATPHPPRRTSTPTLRTPPGSTASPTGSVRTGSWRCCSPSRRRYRAPATCSRSRTASGWWR